ncbi:hypothetical protein K2173_015417 [Erythroxylum novogranatense]|uniref:NADH dehydrogenase subunit 4L n=1 Tax=Erythroxylum novogranatense TaxID=1862640 RepID=A0AAV8SSL0_9ROSI|nr:hypothetical protein K2173_015417 [Erythroxylum novogranatense]
MGFLVMTLIFVVTGIIASFSARICCNMGPSTNLLHLTLIITATVCCWMIKRDNLQSPYKYVHIIVNFLLLVYLAQTKSLIVPILSEGE